MTDTTGPHPPAERLQAFGLGRLDDTSSNEVEEHLSACDTCRLVLEGMPADDLVALVRTAVPHEPAAAPPARLQEGYEILEEVGRGGMAVVYRARQLGLGRVVALKRILAGVEATAEELARFRAEAEAVARLAHPNIVQVYDVGEQDGRPYLALEFLDGGSLADRLGGGPLPPRDAAAIVEPLARAIDYAHGKGVVHRDLKPANVLLARNPESGIRNPESEIRNPNAASQNQGEAVSGIGISDLRFHSDLGSRISYLTPKIADFGLAKRLDVSLVHTRTGALLGTPSYMAPEQTTGDPSAVGPPADVYALGAILYECLTGRPPFRGATLLETLEQVRLHEPAPPRRLQPGVPRDLETICLKCLEKEPRRRYASAGDLAEDLRRFLAGEPIVARPAGFVERAWKWARRRPAWAALILVSTASLAALTAGGWVVNLRLRAAVRDTDAARQRAEDNFRNAESAIQHVWWVGANRLTDVPETLTIREYMLREALRLYEGLLPKDPRDDPRSANNYAQLLGALAGLRAEQNCLDEARRLNDDVLDRLAFLIDAFPEDPSHREAWGVFRHDAGHLFERMGRVGEAEAAYRDALAALEAASRSAGVPHQSLPRTYAILAGRCKATGRGEEAEALYRKGIEVAEALVAARPKDEYVRETAAILHHDWGLQLLREGRQADARAALTRAVALLEPMADNRVGARRFLTPLATAYETLAVNEGLTSEAENLLKKSIVLRERLARQFPDDVGRASGLARGLANLGSHYLRTNRFKEAEAQYVRAAALDERAAAEVPDSAHFQVSLAETLNNLGLAQGGRPDEARKTYERAEAVLEALHRRFPEEVRYAKGLGANRVNHAGVLRALERPKEARDLAGHAIEVLEAVRRKAPTDAEAAGHLFNAYGQRAQAHTALGLHAEAAADYEQVTALAPGMQRDGFRLVRALSLAAAGRHADAAAVAKELAGGFGRSNDDFYNIACLYALASSAAAKDDALAPADRAKRADEHAEAALALLDRLHRSGYFKDKARADHLKKDTDLAALHGRPAFRKLLSAASP